MSAYRLVWHAGFSPLGVRGVEVDAEHIGNELVLTYRVEGGDRIVWPQVETAGRTDELWRTTCFEVFVRFDDGECYVEFNFSPSTQWAAYAFDGYREGMAPLELANPPVVRRLPNGVRVSLDLSGLPRGELAMALTAVIEEEGGVKSYWSLAHPPGAPDFHHPACFAATLPPPSGA